MTILIPLAVTIAAFAWAFVKIVRFNRRNGLLSPIGGAIVAMFTLPFAGVVSLAAWLTWALLA